MSKFDIFNPIAISAGAGSGKTYTLSRRYINILVGFNLFYEDLKTPIDTATLKTTSALDIVTITYTEAGALEMRSRIFELVQKVLAFSFKHLDEEDGDYSSIKRAFNNLDTKTVKHVQTSLSQAIKELSGATISTIHSYCLDLLSEYSDYLKLDAKPSIVADDEKIVIFSKTYREELNKEASLVEEIDQIVSLYKLSQIAQKYSFDAGFRTAFDSYVENLDKESFSLQDMWLSKKLLPFREDLILGLEAAQEMAVLDPRKKAYTEALFNNIEVILAGAGEWIPYEGQLRKSKVLTAEVLDPVRKVKSILEKLKCTLVNVELENEYKTTVKKIQNLFFKMYEAFINNLKEEGYTDFETILQYANKLLDKDIRLQTQYFMIDEFQDTNIFQWGIIKKAASKNDANIFIVGDEKQSIFSFQGADVSVFAKASDDINAKKISMGVNRRSDAFIIKLVNDIFTLAMSKKEQGSNKALSPVGDAKIDTIIEQINKQLRIEFPLNDYEATYESLDTPEGTEEGSVDILITPVDHTNEEGEDCSETELEMRHIASFIKEAVTTDKYPKVQGAYDDGKKAIAILFDTRKHMLQLKQKLLELGLKSKVSDSANFYNTKEINDIFIVLKLIVKMKNLDFNTLTRKDRYILIGALRSNILRLDANAIDRVINDRVLPDICIKWQKESIYLTPYELIEKIISDSKLLHVYRNLDGFEQREANIQMLLSGAYDYCASKGSDLYLYVKELEALIHNSDVSEDEAFMVEEGVGSIEIRTIHSSKGLEWPMVILGSTNRSFMGMQPSEGIVFDTFMQSEMIGFKIGNYEPLAFSFIKERQKAKHIAERKRLLYVAMTRPEHHLVISTAINKYKQGSRLCFNCGDKNYFSIMNQFFKFDLEALFLKEIEDERLHYPPEWKGTSVTKDNIKIIREINFKTLDFSDQSIVRPSGKPDPMAFLKEEKFDAGNAGTAVHKIIEESWKDLDNEAYYVNYFKEYSVPKQWQEKIKTMAKAFKNSPHYKKLHSGVEAYFEHDFTMVVNETKVYGSIDLFYYDKEKKGWIVVDFKTTDLQGLSEEEAVAKHGYDKQLDLYASFIESVMGEGTVVSKEISWLKHI